MPAPVNAGNRHRKPAQGRWVGPLQLGQVSTATGPKNISTEMGSL